MNIITILFDLGLPEYMDTTYLLIFAISIGIISVCGVVAGDSMRIQRETANSPKFTSLNAEWWYESARGYYVTNIKKPYDVLTDKDNEIIWKLAGNHIAMLFTWMVETGLAPNGNSMGESYVTDIERLKRREITGTDFLCKQCDFVITQDDFLPEAQNFMNYYQRRYMPRYSQVMLKRHKTVFLEFNWEDYNAVARLFSIDYKSWKRAVTPAFKKESR